ncbi:SNF2-related protein [Roseibacillus persicicus]|uniref:SNF2-related protein n=1 Tax=Roseibacillus persicicus TaxID=454148 RepID=UPI0028108844|nr:SNF2-related protein [Roseibacillus persicicus]MDQ8188759.1 SNF2-related protein [Roseibacillus persicicus]
MPLTPHQAKYLAHELTRRWSSDSVGSLAAAVAGAQVDLNPHQVDAALFAFKSPFSNGALLADEVGLGKTIEAGILLSQRWAERRRRILIITPSNLRKQWHQELAEKFFLPSLILEAKSYNKAKKGGSANPFQPDEPNLVICSYHFARNKAKDIVATPWDLVVIDEAHRLRNVYKTNNVIANELKRALEGRPKVLLTATPLQNSLLELFGLISFIDEHAFGDLKSFRQQFANLNQDTTFLTLKDRLAPLCHRTLRRQVTQYVPYTARHALIEEFTPQETEDHLYQLVSDYLARDDLFALPPAQRTLMTLVLRKLLASSTFAIAGALQTMADRLHRDLMEQENLPLQEELDDDYEALDETADEWTEDDAPERLSLEDRAALEAEISELRTFAELARKITENSKGLALLRALRIAFDKASSLGAAEKAIIFTESRRTQDYLLQLLSESDWSEGLVLFNGTNTDSRSKEIYANWIERHQGSDRVTGSRTADMRSALVDYFRDEGRIMIATEAGAEGINLQFCSLIINYDLPWNPQRVEQRIGRCHRYGQKHDVVVVNFLNKKNAADQRVYQLLAEKFQLFEGVFGASDEVLGAIGSGIDFEKRIASIYQQCRQPEDIKSAFDDLQLELSFEINEAMTTTRKKLLEHFDDEVREKLRDRDEDSKAILGQFERQLIRLSRHELNGHAHFDYEGSFELLTHPFPDQPELARAIPLGRYELPRRTGEAHFYRIGHPLADVVIAQAKERELSPEEITFSYDDHEGKISILEPLLGQSGWLAASRFTVNSLDQTEDYLILAAHTDSGQALDEETARRLLSLPGQSNGPVTQALPPSLDELTQKEQARISRDISERNAEFFEAEATKLDNWADDLKVGLEREIKDIDRQIKEARRAASAALSLEEKLAGQKQIKTLENHRKERRRSLFDAQDEIDDKRERLIESIEGKLKAESSEEQLFTIRWNLK